MDEQIFFAINGAHNIFLDQLMTLLTGKMVWVPLYLSLLYVVWYNYSWRGVLGVLLMVGVGMLFTDMLNSQVIRPWIGRLRPSNPDNPIAPLVHVVNGRHGNGCGFPSAHSANMWMLTFIIAHWLRNYALSFFMAALSLLICYSRVYLGYHYPGDILGGFVWAFMVVYVLRYIHIRCFKFASVSSPGRIWVPISVMCVILLSMLCYSLIEI
ncbi:MAG: phosphatase PAP2 family protein [Prevotella sp.]|nr:phosphatase PAP2 family protein [Prevotella sp.]